MHELRMPPLTFKLVCLNGKTSPSGGGGGGIELAEQRETQSQVMKLLAAATSMTNVPFTTEGFTVSPSGLALTSQRVPTRAADGCCR